MTDPGWWSTSEGYKPKPVDGLKALALVAAIIGVAWLIVRGLNRLP